MERKRFSVLFFIKRSKLLKNGEAPVRVRVTYDRLYVELQLKRSVKVPLWSQEKEKSTGKDRNSVELNHYIDALRVKFYQIYQDLELKGKIISARAIVNRYQGKDETFKTLCNVFKEHNDNCRKLIGTDYADITVRRYDNCLKYLMELVKRDYKVDDMLLREVNGELVRKFDLYLKTEKHCAQNTVIRYMKCFKKVINLAIANEWLTKNPFAGIKFHEVEVNKQFLSQAEINRIWQKEFRIERLELVRDVFIFCVFTGLAFIDVYNLRPEHVSEDSNGNLWIVKPREKTNNLCNIPLLSIPKQILEKYKDNPYCMDKGTLLPVPCNQKMNSYLKEIADLCGIKKNLTTHTARHSVMVDQGGGSTEVSVFNQGELEGSYSINLGTTALRNILTKDIPPTTLLVDAFKKSDQMLRERMVAFTKNMNTTMQTNEDTFCVSVGSAITHATGKKKNAQQHDCILNYEQIADKIENLTTKLLEMFNTVGDLVRWEQQMTGDTIDDMLTLRMGLPMYLLLMEKFNIKQIHVCGTGLWYGIYLQHLFNVAD